MKIEDYDILVAPSTIILSSMARDWMNNGWTPIGGVCWNDHDKAWAQALVKIECKPCNEKEE